MLYRVVVTSNDGVEYRDVESAEAGAELFLEIGEDVLEQGDNLSLEVYAPGLGWRPWVSEDGQDVSEYFNL